MILGLGVDVLETGRVQRELEQDQWQPGAGIFTAGEIRHCSGSREPARRYAACFAAKEAVLKALGIEIRDLAMFREVEVKAGLGRGYEIVLHDRLKEEAEQLRVQKIKLSMACSSHQTGAVVILEASH